VSITFPQKPSSFGPGLFSWVFSGSTAACRQPKRTNKKASVRGSPEAFSSLVFRRLTRRRRELLGKEATRHGSHLSATPKDLIKDDSIEGKCTSTSYVMQSNFYFGIYVLA
jgi:hypothetical protein